MIHRHLEIASDLPPEELPAAALVDVLERGDLEAWRPIAAAIALDPFGALAERAVHLLDAFPMYGTSALWRAWIDHRRAREEGRRGALPPLTLSALRRRAGLTQTELARRLGMSQSDLSKLERRSDVRVSTLAKFAEALGGRIRIEFAADLGRFALRFAPAGGGGRKRERR